MGIIYKNGIPYGNQPSIDATLTHQGEAADAKATGDAVSELRNTLNHKADVIYDTAIGDIASFSDGADGLPVKDLTVGIEPVQDTSGGDPSPTHICPISGWTGCNVTRTGKNLLGGTAMEANCLANKTSESIVVDQTNHTITVPNTSEGPIFWLQNNKPFKENTQYTFIFTGSGTSSGRLNMWVHYSDGSSTAIPRSDTTSKVSTVFVTSANKTVAYVRGGNLGGTYTLYTEESGIFEGVLTASDFVPYTDTTIPISWQSSAGTVYAASLDALAGSLKVRPYYASYNGETLVGPWISSMDAYTPGGTPTTGAQVVDFGGSETLYSLDSITLNTLLGQNNIWADCGQSTVEYPCDTKLYIQKINTPTDDDMIADANIASGKYFIVNNNLYLSTSAILAGDPIKPGTNCTLTNLAAALNAINS